jgi:hypothetical protein
VSTFPHTSTTKEEESVEISNRKVYDGCMFHRFAKSSSTISIPDQCQNPEEKGHPAMRCTTLFVAPMSQNLTSIIVKVVLFQPILLRLDTVLH